MPASSAAPPTGDSLTVLSDEIHRLRQELETMRRDLAAAQLREREKDRELAELRQFIDDHHELGRDFVEYRAVKAAAEIESRRKAADSAPGRRRRRRG